MTSIAIRLTIHALVRHRVVAIRRAARFRVSASSRRSSAYTTAPSRRASRARHRASRLHHRSLSDARVSISLIPAQSRAHVELSLSTGKVIRTLHLALARRVLCPRRRRALLQRVSVLFDARRRLDAIEELGEHARAALRHSASRCVVPKRDVPKRFQRRRRRRRARGRRGRRARRRRHSGRGRSREGRRRRDARARREGW